MLEKHSDFKHSLILLLTKLLELADKDLYPDFLGVDNVVICMVNNSPKIALIDPHVVTIGKYANEVTKSKLKDAIERFKVFLIDPNKLENVKFLASGEFK
ncbi:MAG: hypothetical protein Fur003_2350 [Candidatus Dojkabacteria bacterium]